MWAAIERESAGRIHAQFFPNSQLGGDTAMLSQLRLGALQFFHVSPGNLSTLVPVADIAYVGFAYKDDAEGSRVADGPLGDYIRKEVAAKGIYALRTMFSNGMIHIGSNLRPIRTPEDLHGFKLRVSQSKITVDLFKALGASPTPINVSELYTALQTKLLDGEEAPIVTIATSRWYEVNKYISFTNHEWAGNWIVANGDVWKTIPADLQDLIERNCTKYAHLERRDVQLFNSSVADKLQRLGMTINDVNQTPFRALLRSYYSEWAGVFGATAWGLLESSLGRKLTS